MCLSRTDRITQVNGNGPFEGALRSSDCVLPTSCGFLRQEIGKRLHKGIVISEETRLRSSAAGVSHHTIHSKHVQQCHEIRCDLT